MKTGIYLGGTPAGFGYGAQATVYINAIEAAGATPTATEKTAIDTFYSTADLTLWKRLFLPVWASAAPNAIDMVDPTRSGTWNGGVTHSAGYATGNGTTGYFDFGTHPNAEGIGPSSASLALYVSADESGATIGAGDAPAGRYLEGFILSSVYFDCCSTTGTGRQSYLDTGNSPRTKGVILMNRASAGGVREVKDRQTAGIRTLITATNADAGATFSRNIYAMARNLTGTADAFDTTNHSLFGLGLGHSPAQATVFLNGVYDMLNSFTTHKPTMV